MVEGVGWVEWPVRDATGQTSILQTQAYYIPSASVRLFAPCQCGKDHANKKGKVGRFSCFNNRLTFVNEYQQTMFFDLNDYQRVPHMPLTDKALDTGYTPEMAYNLNLVRDDERLQGHLDDINHNISRPQKELKLWHMRLGHAGFQWIQDLIRI